MSRWRPERGGAGHAAGVDATHVAWHAGSLRLQPLEQALPAIAAAGGHRHWVLSAGHDMAVHWLQQPPGHLRSLRELRLVAAARCAHLHGRQPQDWWVAADWSADQPFVCAALPMDWVSRVEAQAQRAGLRTRWTTGWLAACRQRSALAADGWHALRTPRRAVLWQSTGGRVRCLASLATPPGDDAGLLTQLQRQVRLECARDARLAPGDVRCEHALQGEATEAEAAWALHEDVR